MYYRPCPICGAHLDPGEVCDCERKEEAASSGANTESGKPYEFGVIITPDGGKSNA